MKNRLFKHVIVFEGEEADMEKMMGEWEKGDSRCRFQPGDKVMKVYEGAADNGLKPIGARGTVEGAMYTNRPDRSAIDNECYLILWDGDDKAMLTVGVKVGKPL